ncbi:MAG TPA: methyltransferase domain-containing protein [Solirubrobacteraceae bacterium]|nr:methyltransferase domain-containing protein [Solirubrobacteraceae bacterium]
MSVSGQQRVPPPAEVWSTGDYADVCDTMIPRLGARLVELADVRAGDDVLDVAAGSGNAAIPAARAGAVVTALDITPPLLEIGSERARAAGLDIDWVLGDATTLPFDDESFDDVVSCVGVQFVADQAAAASELLRVCRAGGRIALIAWTREGFLGQVLAAVSAATGGAGAARSPLDWGSEAWVTETFHQHVADIAFDREHVQMPAESPSGWVDYMATAYGPLVRARVALEARGAWEPLRARLSELAAAHRADDGDMFNARAEYLTAVLQR